MFRVGITFRHAAGSGHPGLLVLPALLGLLALLAAGCDYWENATEPKKVAKGDLRLAVIDAWTREPLPGASCAESGTSWPQMSDESGYLIRTGMDTGPYTLVCVVEPYYSRRLEVSVKAGKVTASTVALARRGGDGWYAGNPSRQVSFGVVEGTGRFPGKMRFQAYPSDTGGIFSYLWTSTHHRNLPATIESSVQLHMEAQPQDKDTVEVTMGLRVMATLAERTFEVGSASIRVPLRRNLFPAVGFFGNIEDSIKVGCREETDVFRFGLIASDPDGQCKSVTITNNDSTSSLGKVFAVRNCSQGEVLEFPLKGHASGLGVSLTLKNRLSIRVTDDNDQSQDTVLDFETYSTLPHKISLEQEEATEKNFPDTPLKFRIKSGSGNSGFNKLFLDWKDGRKDTLYLASSRIESFDRSFVHDYGNPGVYEVEARMVDKCDDTSKVTLAVPVAANRLPKIGLLDPRGFQPSNDYQLYVEASDDDVGAGLDSLSIQVVWGDGQVEPSYQAAKYQSIKRLFTHRYPTAWASPTFRIEVTVSDAHAGKVFDTVTVAKPAAAITQATRAPAALAPAFRPSEP